MIKDDVVLNYWNLLNADKKKLWNVHKVRTPGHQVVTCLLDLRELISIRMFDFCDEFGSYFRVK